MEYATKFELCTKRATFDNKELLLNLVNHPMVKKISATTTATNVASCIEKGNFIQEFKGFIQGLFVSQILKLWRWMSSNVSFFH